MEKRLSYLEEVLMKSLMARILNPIKKKQQDRENIFLLEYWRKLTCFLVRRSAGDLTHSETQGHHD